jgi:hypothetical protein
MNSTRNVDPDDLFDLTDLPPPFENSGGEEEEEGEEDDSTLQKIRHSIQLEVSGGDWYSFITHRVLKLDEVLVFSPCDPGVTYSFYSREKYITLP